jgi:hypothetical protein
VITRRGVVQISRRHAIAATILLTLGIGFFASPNAAAANPAYINFQGKVVNSNSTNVTDGSYSFTFKLYTAGTGGSLLWTETKTLTVTSGTFQTELGDTCPIFTANACNSSTPLDFNATANMYLGITFNSDPAGEMSPRIHFDSVPYAFNSDKVGGLSASQLARNDASNTFTAAQLVQLGSNTAFQIQNATSTSNLFVANTNTSKIGIGTASPAEMLNVYNGNEQIDYGNLKFSQLSAPSAPTVADGGAGSVGAGTYYYAVTYVTASGETNYGTASSGVTIAASHQVSITNIPTGTSGVVTARKIYRGTSSSGPFQLVSTINNNTATSTADNTASPGAIASAINTTGGLYVVNSTTVLNLSPIGSNAFVGAGAGNSSLYGFQNTGIGTSALQGITSGVSNTSLGYNALNSVSSGNQNTSVGTQSLSGATGSNNTAIGFYAGFNNTSGNGNSFVGFQSGWTDSSNHFSTLSSLQNAAAIGAFAQVQADNTIVLGSVDTATKVGIGTTVPSNTFSVSPLDYQAGTATRTNGSATLVGTSTTWTSSMVGDQIVFADGTTNTVSAFTDATHITMGSSYVGTTDAAPAYYRFHTGGFQVTSSGDAYVQNTSATAFRVQNAVGINVLAIDTSVGQVVIGGASPLVTTSGATALALNPGGAAALNLGTLNANAVNIGNTTASTTVSIEAGTGANSLKIGAGATVHDVDIGTGAAAQNVSLGSTNTTSTTLIQGGSNDITLNTSTGNSVIIGSATTDTNQTLLQLDSFSTYADTAACTTISNQGGLYFNTNTAAIRACINGGWEDLASTAGLGILGFGVVSDTGSNPGDTQSLTTASTATGPCQPYRASATSVGWTTCSAYSGGRKIVVTAGTAATTNSTIGNFQHLCLNGTNNQPTLSTSAADTIGWPAFSAASPVLCLADIKFAAANNTISSIYDTRVFTNTQKEFAYTAAAMVPGHVAIISTAKITTSGTTAGAANVRGVIGVSDATTVGTNGAPNAILVTNGPALVRATAGTAGQYVENGTTAGYAITTATAPTTNIYSSMGVAQSAFSSTCSTQINCFGSVLVNLAIR